MKYELAKAEFDSCRRFILKMGTEKVRAFGTKPLYGVRYTISKEVWYDTFTIGKNNILSANHDGSCQWWNFQDWGGRKELLSHIRSIEPVMMIKKK